MSLPVTMVTLSPVLLGFPGKQPRGLEAAAPVDGSLLSAQGAKVHHHCQPCGDTHRFPSCSLQPAAGEPLLCTPPSFFSTSGPVTSGGDWAMLCAR